MWFFGDADKKAEKAPQDIGVTDTKYDLDDRLLDMAVAEAGRWSYGVVAVDVWLYNESGRLVLPNSGLWIDPVYFQNDDEKISNALQALTNPQHQDYDRLTSLSLSPGEGLPGVLWSETNNVRQFFRGVGQALDDVIDPNDTTRGGSIDWRRIAAIANDPDQPYNPRIKVIVEAGFSLAAGIRFDVRGCKGIVVFMARDSVNLEKLNSILNEEYMMTCTEFIGSCLAIRKPRQMSINARKQDAKSALKKAKMALYFMVSPSTHYHKEDDDLEPSKVQCGVFYIRMKSFFSQWGSKMYGGGVKPPPPMILREVAFTFVATFVTYAIMVKTSDALGGDKLNFNLGNNAAVTNMAYALTAAPAAQPRNIILGQTVAMLCAIFFAYLQSNMEWSDWLCSTLSVTFCVSLNGALGITHPPAGALSKGFMSNYIKNKDNISIVWKLMGAQLLGNTLLISLASVINNFNKKRQYPTFWGYVPNFIMMKASEKTAKKKN